MCDNDMVIIKTSIFLSYIYYSITCNLGLTSKYSSKEKNGINEANVRKMWEILNLTDAYI